MISTVFIYFDRCKTLNDHTSRATEVLTALNCLGLRVPGIIKTKNQRHLLGQNFALTIKVRSETVREDLDERKEKRGEKKSQKL